MTRASTADQESLLRRWERLPQPVLLVSRVEKNELLQCQVLRERPPFTTRHRRLAKATTEAPCSVHRTALTPAYHPKVLWAAVILLRTGREIPSLRKMCDDFRSLFCTSILSFSHPYLTNLATTSEHLHAHKDRHLFPISNSELNSVDLHVVYPGGASAQKSRFCASFQYQAMHGQWFCTSSFIKLQPNHHTL
jgi:hypothetical protein